MKLYLFSELGKHDKFVMHLPSSGENHPRDFYEQGRLVVYVKLAEDDAYRYDTGMHRKMDDTDSFRFLKLSL